MARSSSSSSSALRSILVVLLAGVASLSLLTVNAQVPTPGQTDPTAVCPTDLNDQIMACRSQVYTIEAALPQGPCWSSDWACICNVQQGLLDCYAPCPGNTPQTDIDYNNANCAGQNGVSNAAAVPGGAQYSGGVLTTTGGGATGASTTSAVTTTNTPTTSSTTSSAAAAVAGTGDSTLIISSGTTTTIPNTASSSSSSNTNPNPKDSPTPVQSTSTNVFGGGNTTGAASRKVDVMNGNGSGIMAGLMMGLMSVLILVRL